MLISVSLAIKWMLLFKKIILLIKCDVIAINEQWKTINWEQWDKDC